MFPVLNYRKGFACNSSSSHSVIFMGADKLFDDDIQPGNYGWDRFTLASREAKERYFEQQLDDALAHYSDAERRRLIDALAKDVPEAITETRQYVLISRRGEGYIDHQSEWVFPKKYDGNRFLGSYVQALWNTLMRDDVAVLGGNDNDGEHTLAGSHASVVEQAWSILKGSRPWCRSGLPTERAGLVGRDDGDYFTLFGRDGGDKMRVSKPGIKGVVIKSASRPELVDVKITDWCDKGCKYCYQDSTTAGKHAAFGALKEVIDALAELEVFEVAFGGGEPTSHPQFLELLEYTRSKHVIPNFTTRNIPWLEANATAVNTYCGAFAFSVDSAAQGRSLVEMFTRLGDVGRTLRNKAQLQVVDGAVTTAALRAINRLELPLLLLGWKTTGRGDAALRKKCDWEAALKTEYAPAIRTVHCDTAFYDQYKKRFTELKADPRTIGGPEGTFSCYVDAVKGRIGPSSFCAPSEYQELEPFHMAGSFADAWAAIRAKAEPLWGGMADPLDDDADVG